MSFYEDYLITIEDNSADEIALANVVSAIMIGLYLTNISEGIGRFIGISSSMVSLISKGMIFLALVRCIPIFLNRVSGVMCCVFFLILAVIACQGAFFEQNVQFFHGKSSFLDSTIMVFAINVLPAVVTFSVIEDCYILLNQMKKAGSIISIITMLVLVIYGGRAFENYAMGFANATILPTILMIISATDKENRKESRIFYSISILVDTFSVAVYGSRGAFLAILLFSVYYFMWKQLLKKNIISYCALGIIVVVGTSYKKILKSICQFALSIGFYSRTLVSLSSEEVYDSGRSIIYKTVLSEIKQHPFMIRGINADYNLYGAYCHNWFLELIYAFGILFGGILCVVIIYYLIKCVKYGVRDQWSKVCICLMFSFFPICLVSGSIWQNTWFWCWVVICVRFLRNLAEIENI